MVTPISALRSPAPGSAAPLALPRKRRVLFVTDFYMESVLAGVVEHAREAGWDLIANMRFHGKFPSESSADGILATAVTARVQNWLSGWQGVPVVQMYASGPQLPHPLVESDFAAAGRAGAQHLLELGHIHFGFYWLQALPDTEQVLAGFAAAVRGAGRTMHHLDFPAAHPGRPLEEIPREARLAWLAEELRRLPKPLAMMGDDDRRSLEVLAACERAGLRVPEDVAILGCEDRAIELGLSRLPMSSVDMNHPRIGREAAALLEDLMNGVVPRARHVRVPPLGVIGRRSTATFVSDSPGVTAALLHLREHFHERLHLPALARLAGMSERLFESEFKRCVGRSPRAELQRARLACATRLLRDTDLKLDAVAAESGFGTAKRLCAIFAQTYSATPTAWRQQPRLFEK